MADTTYDHGYLDSILRGELASVETYNQTIEKFAGKIESSDLIKIRDEHQEHVVVLSEHVTRAGGKPSTSSGPWGTFTQLFVAGAKLVGPETALAALKTGEQHGIEQYEKAIERKDLPADTVSGIRDKLLPQARGHIGTLDRLIATHAAKA